MVNKSTSVNKTNNHLSSQITIQEQTTTYGIGKPGPGLEQAQKCGRVKLVNGYWIIDNWISNNVVL